MPEAAIEEHRDLRAPKYDIRAMSSRRLGAAVNAVSEPRAVDCGSQGQFSCGIAPRLVLQSMTNLLRGSGGGVSLSSSVQFSQVGAGDGEALGSIRTP